MVETATHRRCGEVAAAFTLLTALHGSGGASGMGGAQLDSGMPSVDSDMPNNAIPNSDIIPAATTARMKFCMHHAHSDSAVPSNKPDEATIVLSTAVAYAIARGISAEALRIRAIARAHGPPP